jgi:hypothetical protein
MGRILDLCGEIAAVAEEGTEGLVLSPEAWDRFRADWTDEDIDDALGFVRDSLFQGELVAAADSLSARMVEVLGGFGTSTAFAEVAGGRAVLSLESIAQLARRVDRLEEVLEPFRDWEPPDRRGFDSLRRRLADHGIEHEMESDAFEDDGHSSADGSRDSDEE